MIDLPRVPSDSGDGREDDSTTTPLEPVYTDRNPGNGRFLAGNQVARNNGAARKIRRLKTALLKSATVSDFRQIARKLIGCAKNGDGWAIRLCIENIAGLSKDTALELRLDDLESLLNQ